MGYEYDKQLLSLLHEKSKEGMAIAIIGPRKSLQRKTSESIHNLPYLITTEIGLQTEANTTLDRETPTRDRDEQARGNCCLREHNQHMSSWKLLKDRLLSPNYCNRLRCPTIQERLELHNLQMHREQYTKPSSCKCKSKLEMDKTLHQNKLNDKSMPCHISELSTNADKNLNRLDKNQINDTYKTNHTSKYHGICMKPTKEDVRKDEISNKDNFTIPDSINVISTKEVDVGQNTSSTHYVDNFTMSATNDLEKENKSSVANINVNNNDINEYPEKLKHNDATTNIISPGCVDFCNSPFDFSLEKVNNSKKDFGGFCDVPVHENYTTTYSSSYTGEFDKLRQPFFKKITFDQMHTCSSPGIDSIVMLDNSNSPRKISEIMIDKNISNEIIMIDKSLSPRKSSKINIDNYNCAQTDMQTSRDTNTDFSQPSTSQKYGNTCDKNFGNQVIETNVPYAMQTYDFKSQEKHNERSYRNFEISKYVNNNATSNSETLTDGIHEGIKYPILPLKRVSNQLCVQPSIPLKINRVTKESSTSNTNIFKIVEITPDTTSDNYYTSFEHSQCVDCFTTTCSFERINNFKAAKTVLPPRRANYNQTVYSNHYIEQKFTINYNKSVQFILNTDENEMTQFNSLEECEENDCATQAEILYRDEGTENLKCVDFCITTDNNVNTDITALSIYPSVLCDGGTDMNNSMTSNSIVFATQTGYFTPNETVNGDCCKTSDKPKYIDKSSTPCSNISKSKSSSNVIKPNAEECKFCSPKISNESLHGRQKFKTSKDQTLKSCDCSDHSASSKKLSRKVNDKSTGSETSLYSCKNFCPSKSPNDSNSLNSDISVSKSIDRCPIFNEVNEWILGVPVKPAVENGTNLCNNKAINHLVNKLKQLSKDAEKPEYDEKVRKEIDRCLSKISIVYPGDKKEKGGFKKCLNHRLFQRVKKLNRKNIGTTYSATERESPFSASKLNFSCQILSKDVEIRIAIREWLQKITKGSSMTENQLSQLADFVVIRISPLLNIPVSTYNHRIILKAAIADVLNDLSIGNTSWLQNKDLQTHNQASDLAEKLLCIQAKYSTDSKKSNLSTNKYSELKGCIDVRESAICTQIKRCLLDACVEPKDTLVEEVGYILMGCYEIPHPQAERDAKKEIVNILITSTSMSESQASRLATNVMKKVRKVLRTGKLSKACEDAECPHQSRNSFANCTILLCTIETANPFRLRKFHAKNSFNYF